MTILKGLVLAIGPLAVLATGTDFVTDKEVIVNTEQICTVDVRDREFTISCGDQTNTYPLKLAKRKIGISRVQIRATRTYSCKPAYKVGGMSGIRIPFTDARECRGIA